MKRYIYNKVEKALKGLLPLLMLTVIPTLTACSDDDDAQSTAINISKVINARHRKN